MAKIGTRIPEDQDKQIQKVVEDENYSSKSEFVREAIRNELRKRAELKKQVIKELKKRERQVEDGKIEIEDMKTTDEVFEEIEG